MLDSKTCCICVTKISNFRAPHTGGAAAQLLRCNNYAFRNATCFTYRKTKRQKTQLLQAITKHAKITNIISSEQRKRKTHTTHQ